MSVRAANFDTNQVAIDTAALGKLKRSAGQDPKSALRATAQQFETLFMNMLMKSMRDTLPKEGMLSSSANDMYTGMLDQQFAQKMSSRGTGIADMIVKQLSQQMKTPDSNDTIAPVDNPVRKTAMHGSGDSRTRPVGQDGVLSERVTGVGASANAGRPGGPTPVVFRFENQQTLNERLQGPAGSNRSNTGAAPALGAPSDAPGRFVQNMKVHAEDAERITGVPAKFMLGQAALESGWGKKEISHADGSPAHNLFGIKAGSSWAGKTVSVTTTEYIGGVAQKVVEKFRAYGSYAESFRDYANLIAGSPRYQDVIKKGGNVEGFANAMQRSGYATDPRYAEKLTRTINQMLSLSRADPRGVETPKEI